MEKVYLVLHTSDVNQEYEDVKMIGVFSSRNRADQVITDLKTKPGFEEAKRGFTVEELEVDAVEWKDGYVIVDRGEPQPR